MMMEEEHGEYEECDCGDHMHEMMGKEFKLALLEKKEKMVEAKLEFIRKMKEIVKKMPDEKE
jgi:hypothetical protein